jgi:hypothetical protein
MGSGSRSQPVLQRVQVPDWSPSGRGFQVPGFDPWEYPTRWLHRVLAAPASGEPLPAFPTDPNRHEQSIAYWSCLDYLLRYSLGWTDPGAGLEWWYRTGKPTENDSRLELIADIWDVEGLLDLYLAWTGGSPYEDPLETKRWRAVQSERASNVIYPPFGEDGYDPLHLAFHRFPEWSDNAQADWTLLRSDAQRRSATFITDAYVSWYSLLDTAGEELSDLGERSWRVDVVVRSVGWLGTYRRSRVTGRWFSGPHRLHVRGCLASEPN